jgi:hypothetical protein
LAEVEEELLTMQRKLEKTKVANAEAVRAAVQHVKGFPWRFLLMFLLLAACVNVAVLALFNPSFSRSIGAEAHPIVEQARTALDIPGGNTLISLLAQQESRNALLARNLTYAQLGEAECRSEISMKRDESKALAMCRSEQERVEQDVFYATKECNQKKAAAVADCNADLERAAGSGEAHKRLQREHEDTVGELEKVRGQLREQQIRERIFKEEFSHLGGGSRAEHSTRDVPSHADEAALCQQKLAAATSEAEVCRAQTEVYKAQQGKGQVESVPMDPGTMAARLELCNRTMEVTITVIQNTIIVTYNTMTVTYNTNVTCR